MSLNIFSVRNPNLLLVLVSFSQERLTCKQKKILEYLASHQEAITITQLVERLALFLQCSHSALWNNLRQLKRIGLLESGHAGTKRIPATLTPIGKYLAQQSRHNLGGNKP